MNKDNGSNKQKTIIRRIVYIAAAVFVLILPMFLGSYKMTVIDNGMVIGLLVIGLVMLVCFTGQLSLGQIAFFAVGAYVMGYSNTVLHIPAIPAILLGIAVAAILGVLVGIPSFNLNGPFLAIVTIGFFKIVSIILTDWQSVTGGPFGMNGIKGIRIGSLNFGKPMPFYYLMLAITAVVCMLVIRFRKSTYGRAMISIMDDEVASNMLGVNTKRVKLISFGVSAAITGLGGALYANFVTYLVPNAFSFAKSTQAIAMAVISGTNVIFAPIVAVIVTIVPEALRSLQNAYMLIFSIILIIFIMVVAYREYKSHNDV